MATNNSLNAKNIGLQSLTSGGVLNGRTLTGTANQISVSNGDGTAGNPTASLTSTIQVTGISFDSGSNTLGNYVQGTYTPTISNATTPPTITYTTQVGRYTRIGNRVICTNYIKINTYAAGTGNLQLSSLPITSVNVSNNGMAQPPPSFQTITFGASVLYYVTNVLVNDTTAQWQGMRSANGTLALAAAGAAANATIISTITYEV